MIAYPFTAVPNWFFQIAPTLKEAELRIMLEVWYQTAGKHRPENVLSYNFLAEQTGITGRSAISNALKELESRELITRQARRINGQAIKTTPAIVPCLPVHIVLQEESVSPARGVSESSKRSHNKIDSESTIQETTTQAGPVESSEPIELLLLSWGIDKTTISRLIPKMAQNGQDLEYLKALWGYVAELKPKSYTGYVVSAITRNWPRKSLGGPGSQERPKQGLDMARYEHGGSSHFLINSNCEICHPKMVESESEAD